MDFVWPYIYGPSFYRKSGLFYELDYSVRSVRKNFKGEARCIVVGDDPGLDVIHLKAPPRVETRANHREVDVCRKMTVVANSPEVGDEFIMMYDDMFLLQPVDVDELRTAYGRTEVVSVSDYIRSRRGSMDYKRAWKSTYEYVKTYRYRVGLATFDWETHTPRYFGKDRLKWLVKNFDLEDNPRLITGLHDGHEVMETTILDPAIHADLWTHTPDMDLDAEFAKRYMNLYDDAIIPGVIDRMKEKFGE